MTEFLSQTVDGHRGYLQSESGADDDVKMVRSLKFHDGLWGLRSHYDKSKGRVVGSCTEILGSESSCDFDDFSATEPEHDVKIQRMAVEVVGHGVDGAMEKEREKEEIGTGVVVRGRKIEMLEEVFPPPLPSLTTSWKYMKAVRKGGRLLLTEATLERPPVVFWNSRVDGRLILQCADVQCCQEEHLVQEEEKQEAEVEEERRRWRMSARRCKEVIRNNAKVDHIAARVL